MGTVCGCVAVLILCALLYGGTFVRLWRIAGKD